jgi:hypothetical protein
VKLAALKGVLAAKKEYERSRAAHATVSTFLRVCFGAIKDFKTQHPHYDWDFFESITKESFTPEKGCKILILTVQTTRSTKGASSRKPRALEKHQLLINKAGDVLEDKILFTQTGNSQNTASNSEMNFPNIDTSILQDILGIANLAQIPETKITLKKIEEPIVSKADREVVVTINFILKNSGKEGKICPYIEFQAAVFQTDGSFKEMTIRSEPQEIEVDALAERKYSYTVKLPRTDVPLFNPPYNVKVELYPCPQSSTR